MSRGSLPGRAERIRAGCLIDGDIYTPSEATKKFLKR
jgi:hypothetical protein